MGGNSGMSSFRIKYLKTPVCHTGFAAHNQTPFVCGLTARFPGFAAQSVFLEDRAQHICAECDP